MRKFVDHTIFEYMKALSAREMVPGGGSASALVAATAVSLNLMVLGYCKREDRTEQEKESVKAQQKEILVKLLDIVDQDTIAFTELMCKLSREEDPQCEYRAAAQAPFEVCRAICMAIATTKDLAVECNASLISDVGGAASMFKGAFLSAKLNVKINLKYIDDRNFIERMQQELNVMQKFVEEADMKVSQKVKAIMKGEKYGENN